MANLIGLADLTGKPMNGAGAMSDSQIINEGFNLAEAIHPLLVGHQDE